MSDEEAESYLIVGTFAVNATVKTLVPMSDMLSRPTRSGPEGSAIQLLRRLHFGNLGSVA